MTIIVWDGVSLWSDSQALYGDYKYSRNKLHSRGVFQIGFAGTADVEDAAIAGFISGSLYIPSDLDKYWYSMLVLETYAINVYGEGTRTKVKTVKHVTPAGMVDVSHLPFYALGSGREFALALLHAGFNGKDTVERTCQIAAGCEGPINELKVIL